MKQMPKRLQHLCIFLMTFLTPAIALAAPGDFRLIDVIVNIGESLQPIMFMVTGASYLAGCWLVFMALYKMKHAADPRSMMYQPFDIKGPIILLLSGTILLFLPAMFLSLTETTFGYSSIIGYDSGGENTDFDTILYYAFEIMKVVGVIAFIRGWFMFAKLADGNQGQGMGSKALTHVLGGLFAYHLYTFFLVLEKTFLGTS